MNKLPSKSNDPKKVILVFTGFVLIATVGLLVPLPFGGRAAPALGDMVHAPLFGFMTLVLFRFWNRLRPPEEAETVQPLIQRVILCGAAAFLFGIASEVCQAVSGRSAAIHDAFANSSGIFAVMAVIVTCTLFRHGELSRLACWCIVLSALLPVGISWWRPVATLYDVYRCEKDFPLLSSFERNAELERWHFAKSTGELSTLYASDGNYSLRANYKSAAHPTVTLFGFNRNWNGMEKLTLCLTLSEKHPVESARVAIQVIDANHNSTFTNVFRREWTLRRGQMKYGEIACVDLRDSSGNELDLSQIRYLDVQLVRPEVATTVHIDDIRLIPKALR